MQSRGIITAVLFFSLCAATALAVWWLVSRDDAVAKGPERAKPFQLARPLDEAKINDFTLTADAVQRLAIETAEIVRQPVPRTTSYGAEVVVPAGQSIIVSAPVSGVLRASGERPPAPGAAVRAGEEVFELLPLLTPEGRANLMTALVDAAAQIKLAEKQRDAANVVYERAKRVFDSEAGSRRAVDDAAAQLDVARQVLDGSIARHQSLESLLGQAAPGTAAPLPVVSPRSGILRTVSVTADQQVPIGAALFEVVDLSRMWIRIPVYVGDLEELDLQAAATINGLAARKESSGDAAAPIAAPPSANLAAGTIDLYYAIDNTQGTYRPGQRVLARLLQQGEAESLTAPWSAIIYDIYGGTWVYERTDETHFIRRRVILHHVTAGLAVLAEGPPPGTKVVTAGAAELFGTETGFTK